MIGGRISLNSSMINRVYWALQIRAMIRLPFLNRNMLEQMITIKYRKAKKLTKLPVTNMIIVIMRESTIN